MARESTNASEELGVVNSGALLVRTLDPVNHFTTDHLLRDLKRTTVSSGLFRGVAQGLQFVMTLVYNIVLARLLTPKDFGLVAMVMTAIAFLQIFRDMQLSTATIQRPDITHAQVSNLFWLNVTVSAAVSILIAAGSPAIAWFYHEPQLVNIALALSPYFILNGLTGQHLALLNRQMRFGISSAIDIASMAASCSLGIVLALAGYGYWSLVAATLAQSFLRLLEIWSTSRWRPQCPVRGVGTRPLINFGANLTISGFLHSLSMGFDGVLIGRFYGSQAVGLYTRAGALLTRPMEQLIAPIYAIAVPALSRLHAEPQRYRRFYLQVFEIMVIGGFLFTGLAMPLALPLTLVILGPRWQETSMIFACLSVAAIYVPLSSAVSWLYTSQGRSQDMLRLTFMEAGVTFTSVLIGIQGGLIGVAAAFSLSGVALKLPLTFRIAGQRGPVSSRDLWLSYLSHSPVLLVVSVATWSMCTLLSGLPAYQQLLLCGTAGLLAGALTIFVSPRSNQVCRRIFEAFSELRTPDLPAWRQNSSRQR